MRSLKIAEWFENWDGVGAEQVFYVCRGGAGSEGLK